MTAASRSSDWLRAGLPIGQARGETKNRPATHVELDLDHSRTRVQFPPPPPPTQKAAPRGLLSYRFLASNCVPRCWTRRQTRGKLSATAAAPLLPFHDAHSSRPIAAPQRTWRGAAFDSFRPWRGRLNTSRCLAPRLTPFDVAKPVKGTTDFLSAVDYRHKGQHGVLPSGLP